MEGQFGYRLLRGKRGVQGHVRKMGSGEHMVLSGLAPGEICIIHSQRRGGKWQKAEMRADQQGGIMGDFPHPGRYFASAMGKVIAWEADGRGEENYLRACALLAREKMEKESQESLSAGKEEAQSMPEEKPAAMAAPDAAADALMEEEPETQQYFLRKESPAPAADALPPLIWPEKAAHLKMYFDMLPPVAPFDLPGWRFVRAPSPVKSSAACILGFQEMEDRVQRVMYGLAGNPFYPPGHLPGYRYLPGRSGQGYWVMEQRMEP